MMCRNDANSRIFRRDTELVSARKKSGCHHAGGKCRVTGEEPNRNQQAQNHFMKLKVKLSFWPTVCPEIFPTLRELNWVTSASAPITDGQHCRVQSRRARQSCDVADFLFVERLARYQRLRERVQLLAVLCQ